MSKYTNEEQEFLDKAAIASMQGMISSRNIYEETGINTDYIKNCYKYAEILLTERKKLFGDE